VGGGLTPGNELLEDSLLQHIYKRCHIETESELDQYLKASLLFPKIDILQWWKVPFVYSEFFIPIVFFY